MRILVTGGTGFVGSHTVAALTSKGHRVRLLARSPDRVEPALTPHRCTVPEVAIGDVTDRASVARALEGCDAVIHAANVFSFDPRRCATLSVVNAQSTEIVLTEASRLDLDPIIHVSSFAALIPGPGPLTEGSEIGEPKPEYCKSKAAAERIARRFQMNGFPVIITYPGSVWGPHDPYLGESDRIAQGALKGRFRFMIDGVIPFTDVRDVAAAHAEMMVHGLGPRRFILVGHNPKIRTLIAHVGLLAGRNLWSIPVPNGMALAAGRASDGVRTRFGVDSMLNFEGAWMMANAARADSSLAINELGIEFMPLETTLVDTIRWLLAEGHISSRQAGSLAA